MVQELKGFIDNEGRLKAWPSKHRKAAQRAALAFMADKIPVDVEMSEFQLNDLLREWHTFGDWALLRRELFESGLITRTPDCRVYRRLHTERQPGNLPE